MNYLKEKSKTLVVLSAVKGEIKKCFSAEQGILKLIVAFDHINYVRYICISTCTLNEIFEKVWQYRKDLITSGYDASSFGDLFRAIANEFFNKEMKQNDGPFRSGYITGIHVVQWWFKTRMIKTLTRSWKFA